MYRPPGEIRFENVDIDSLVRVLRPSEFENLVARLGFSTT